MFVAEFLISSPRWEVLLREEGSTISTIFRSSQNGFFVDIYIYIIYIYKN